MHAPRLLAVAFAALLLAGCQKSLPPQADPDQARAALTAALDAWKEGKSPDATSKLQPPVDFRDPQWDQGAKLVRYKVKDEARSGVSIRFRVELAVRLEDGSTRERVANYNADAGPMMVIRPDF